MLAVCLRIWNALSPFGRRFESSVGPAWIVLLSVWGSLRNTFGDWEVSDSIPFQLELLKLKTCTP